MCSMDVKTEAVGSETESEDKLLAVSAVNSETNSEDELLAASAVDSEIESEDELLAASVSPEPKEKLLSSNNQADTGIER